jgi:glycerophosphoryl diester phosphodiesterase
MLIISHRNNDSNLLQKSLKSSTDMIEFDVRMDLRGRLVLQHDAFSGFISRLPVETPRRGVSTLEKDAKSCVSTLKLDQALDLCFNHSLNNNKIINIEIKNFRAAGPALELIKKYLKNNHGQDIDWTKIIISSFNPLILLKIQRSYPEARLALIQFFNPFKFIFWHNFCNLNLYAIGFYKFNVNKHILKITKKYEMFSYCYTVNKLELAEKLDEMGIDWVVTDQIETIRELFPQDTA